MNNWQYLIYTFLLFALSIIYFRIAQRHKIVDLPNHRTMHQGATIRGGGIIIFIGVLLFSLTLNEPSFFFSGGLLIIGITGFIDDLNDLSSKIRIPIQVLSILLILADLHMLGSHLVILIFILVICTGILNAYNFMDGINGITGGYSLLTVLSMTYVNNYIQHFISNQFLIIIILTLLVFNFFNFRNKAVCFAGDVGSLAVAYIIIYLMIKLIIESNEMAYILFLTIYGIDTIFTIIQRLVLRQNIFEAHRLHLFQVVISKTGKPHLFMTLIYVAVQAIVNFIVILTLPMTTAQQIVFFGIMLLILSLTYVGVKRKLMIDTL